MRYRAAVNVCSTFLMVLGAYLLPARAEESPGVEMVVTFAPGSAADDIARVLARAG